MQKGLDTPTDKEKDEQQKIESSPSDKGYHENHSIKIDQFTGSYRLRLLFFIAVMILVAGTLIYSLEQSWSYVSAISQIFRPFSFHYTPIEIVALPEAVLATVGIVLIGTLAARLILPASDDAENSKLFGKVASLGFGFAIVGLDVMILSDTRMLYSSILEISVTGIIVVLLLLHIERLRRTRNSTLKSGMNDIFGVWIPDFSGYSVYEVAGITAIGLIAVSVYYNALMFPIVETDSIIYHASAAAIAFYNHGMPLIDGGGIGLGISSNYPLLFSYIGTYYYFAVGSVQDVYLKAITPTMWLLSIIVTYLIGRAVGSRILGIVAAFLVSVVPSYTLYAFQTTDETTATFFVALGFLFLINTLKKDAKAYYFIGAGLAFGAACLTSYQSLFFVVPAILVIIARTFSAPKLRLNVRILRNYTLTLLSLIAFGVTPYLRNAIVLHNPVYPFFSNFIATRGLGGWLFAQTQLTLKYVAYSLVDPGTTSTSFVVFISRLFTFTSFYPLNLILIIPSLIVLGLIAIKAKSVLLSFIIIPIFLVLVSPTPFVRYLWLTFPFAAVSVAAMMVYAYQAAKSSATSLTKGLYRFDRARRLERAAIIIVLGIMLIFPTFVVIGGQAYTFIPFPNTSTNDYLRYTANPGANSSTMLQAVYGSDASGWNWLNNHVTGSQRVATFDPRIYYMNFALHNPSRMFYLDASSALPLYQLSSPKSILSFMSSENISYVFVRASDWGSSLFTILPLEKLLGSPYFPILFSDGSTYVYGVGLVTNNPIIEFNQKFPAYTLGLSHAFQVGGVLSENVTMNDNSPRLFVETDGGLVLLNLKYSDLGQGELDINLLDQHTNTWITYGIIHKSNTNRWLSYSLIVPTNNFNNYTIFGLHADQSNITISNISVLSYSEYSNSTVSGRVSSLLEGQLTITNITTPKSLMIYLPLVERGEFISVDTSTSPYNCSIAIYSGYITVNETTNWWLDHQVVASVPASSSSPGRINPSLSWNATSEGLFTIVIANLDSQVKSNINISVSLSTGEGS